MAYRRSGGRRASGVRSYAGRARKSYSRRVSTVRRAPSRTRRAPARGRAARAGQTVRVVIEQAPASAISRPNPFQRIMGLTPQVETSRPKKAKL